MWGSNLLWLSVNISVFLIKVTAIHVYTYWHVFLLENSEEKNTIKSGHECHNDDYLWSSSVIVLFMLYLNIVIYFAEILWPSNLFVPVICYLLNLLLIHSFTNKNKFKNNITKHIQKQKCAIFTKNKKLIVQLTAFVEDLLSNVGQSQSMLFW